MSGKTKGGSLDQEKRAMAQVAGELEALQGMPLQGLRARYVDLFGESPRSKNLVYLRKKLAWRFQELIEGGLTDAAKARIGELAPKALPAGRPKAIGQLRPGKKSRQQEVVPCRDARLPAVGSILKREYQGTTHEVSVQNDHVVYRGTTYGSLSSVAKAITGTAWNGFLFFGLIPKKPSNG